MSIEPHDAPLLTRIIDQACGPLTARLEGGGSPRLMRVHPEVFACVRDLRAREIADGYPLMFLGLELAPDATLPRDGFAFAD
jgi:hypothetical protein